MWMAGGGVQGGVEHGETDDFSYNIVKDPVHINDLNATILHLMGIDHRKFSFKFQGLDQRLLLFRENVAALGRMPPQSIAADASDPSVFALSRRID